MRHLSLVAMRHICLLAALTFPAISPAVASISSKMIVEMRDITSVSVSPDGRLAVVGISVSNTDTNKRDLSWVIVPLHGGSPLKSVPAGEEIYDPGALGAALTRQALWSRDGKWFFYLRRDGEEVQLWETRSDGRMTRRVTHSPSDLIDLKRSSNPDEFIVVLAPDRVALRKAEEDEYRSGILYDDHVIGGLRLTHTLPVIDRWRTVRWSSATGTDWGKFAPLGWTGPTKAVFDVPLRKLEIDPGVVPGAFDVSERVPNRVELVALSPRTEYPREYTGKYTLQLERKTEENVGQKCEIAECIANRIEVIGWSPDGAELYYLADSLSQPLNSGIPGGAAVYGWSPRRNVVRRIYDSGKEGLWGRLYNLNRPVMPSLEPSPIVKQEIVVAFAGADQPPRLEAINLETGISRILFDPNAELRELTQGRAIWHTWETSVGYPGRGIMVLPEDYRVGKTYPAVITTYACGGGFLRGGSGDNAPEFVLAHRGFIAVCLDAQVGNILAHETDGRRLYPILCGIVSGLISDLVKGGKLDPTRVGLSGQSLGANTSAYCISHSNEFAAAALRHGSFPERARWDLFDTASWARGPKSSYARLNMPDPRNDPTGRWNEMSVSHHAKDINAPTLIQTDMAGGFLGALPLWSALHEEGKAAEMYVFPDETHLLTQPIHRLVNFERQLDWFAFWLKGEEDSAPGKRDQYDRWIRLRESTRNSTSQP
jgi:dipeptidyl aminopeptidase/acylaminoacyl peptidase